MDSVFVELDEVKAELEKLRAEYKSRADLSDNLRKAHNEQLSRVQEASLKIEKQAQELNENWVVRSASYWILAELTTFFVVTVFGDGDGYSC